MSTPFSSDPSPVNDDTGESEVITHAFSTNAASAQPAQSEADAIASPIPAFTPEFDTDDSDDTGSSQAVHANHPVHAGQSANQSSYDVSPHNTAFNTFDNDDTGAAHTVAASYSEPYQPYTSTSAAPSQQHASKPHIDEQVRAVMLDDDEPQQDNTHSQYGTVFDIVEAIEALVAEGKVSVFSGGLVRVDRDELLTLMSQLKEDLPVQLERASALMREAETRLDNTQSQANAIISASQARAATIVHEAEEQAEFLASQDNIVAIARDKARDIVHTAQLQADKLTQGANTYSSTVLTQVQDQLNTLQQSVTNGIQVLHERQQKEAEQLRLLQEDPH